MSTDAGKRKSLFEDDRIAKKVDSSVSRESSSRSKENIVLVNNSSRESSSSKENIVLVNNSDTVDDIILTVQQSIAHQSDGDSSVDTTHHPDDMVLTTAHHPVDVDSDGDSSVDEFINNNPAFSVSVGKFVKICMQEIDVAKDLSEQLEGTIETVNTQEADNFSFIASLRAIIKTEVVSKQSIHDVLDLLLPLIASKNLRQKNDERHAAFIKSYTTQDVYHCDGKKRHRDRDTSADDVDDTTTDPSLKKVKSTSESRYVYVGKEEDFCDYF